MYTTSHDTNYWVKQTGVISGPKCMPLIAHLIFLNYGPKYMYLLYRLLIHIVWYLTTNSSWWHKQRFFWSKVDVLIIPLINTYCTYLTTNSSWWHKQRFFWSQVHVLVIPVVNTCKPYLTAQNTGWHKQVWVVFFVCVQSMLMSSFLTLMLQRLILHA